MGTVGAAASSAGRVFGSEAAGTSDTLGTGWQVIDLGPHLRAVRGGVGLRQTEPLRAVARVEVTWGWTAPTLASPHPVPGPSLAEVPAMAFVPIGREPARLARLPGRNAVAKRSVMPAAPQHTNDNEVNEVPKRGRLRGVARDVVFLAILLVTLLGAYQGGRLLGVQKIIVVPESALSKGRVTLNVPGSSGGAHAPRAVAASRAIG